MRLSDSSWEFLMSQEQLFQKPAMDFSLCLIGPNWITWHFLTSIWQGGRILSEWGGLLRSWGGVAYWLPTRPVARPDPDSHQALGPRGAPASSSHKTSSMLVQCRTIPVSVVYLRSIYCLFPLVRSNTVDP